MKVLVIGAGGFIGRHICATLAKAGHEAVRASLRPFTAWERPGAWKPLLAGVDGAVYAAGCLRDQAGSALDLLDLLHHRAPFALARACDTEGVARLVHFSALCGGISAYARSKHAGEVALAGRAFIVRPSLVIGPGGVSSHMLELLSRLPWLPLPASVARCRVQPIRAQDLAAGIVAALTSPTPAASWTAMGPEAATVADWIARRRAARGSSRSTAHGRLARPHRGLAADDAVVAAIRRAFRAGGRLLAAGAVAAMPDGSRNRGRPRKASAARRYVPSLAGRMGAPGSAWATRPSRPCWGCAA
ncbi:MAG: NAD-dependent epimerase/dehydratase family protein [Roseateles sp.]